MNEQGSLGHGNDDDKRIWVWGFLFLGFRDSLSCHGRRCAFSVRRDISIPLLIP